MRSLRQRMEQTAEAEEYERAAKYRDLISTVEQLQEKQRIAAVEGDDADVFGYHFENGMLAVNLFHMRGGRDARPARVLLGRPAGVAADQTTVGGVAAAHPPRTEQKLGGSASARCDGRGRTSLR